MEVVALSATSFLLLFGIITPEEAVSGFSNKAVITIGAMFIMSKALLKTGFLEVLTEKVYLFAGQKKWFTIFVFFTTVAIISGFINNTAAVAIFIPLAIYLGQLMHISPSKLLMPLSFAAIFGGTLTLIGTSTNLLVSSIMVEKGIEPFSIFEFFKLGIIFLIVGTIYNIILAKWFLPSRVVISSLTKKYHMARYLTEFKISEDSSFLGKRINQLDIEQKFDIQILMIIRDQVRYRYNLNTIQFKKDDVILVQINIKDIVSLKEQYDLLLLSDVKMTQKELSGKNHVLVECLLPQESHLIGKTLQELDFKKKYQGFVLAVRRNTDIIREKLAKIKLRFSDTLLVMMPKGKVESFRRSPDLILLEELNIVLKYEGLWWLSIIVIPLIMILTFLNVISIMKASIIGAVILLIVRSLSIQDAYESINWSVIFLIASLIPIGIAIDKTGTDLLIGKLIISIGDLFETNISQEPHLYLAILYIATVLFSAFISNNAIAVIMAPVAIAIAINLNVDPRPFMVAVCFAASNCFMTPIGYQTNLMVYGPGQYKFSDFIKAGLPLTLIFWIISVYFIPIFWPF